MSKANYHTHEDHHLLHRSGWLRAAVLGANDGIISVSALLVGVAAAQPDSSAVLIAGGAALIAGALSMAAGEYVSVSSQTDLEKADIAREKIALIEYPEEELAELVHIYRGRGLSEATAQQVARELTEQDALGAHIRDELGLSEVSRANPLQAALASGLTFSAAGLVPLLAASFSPPGLVIRSVLFVTVLALCVLGIIGARLGGASIWRGAARVVFWGTLAMIITMALGHLVNLFAL